MYICFIQHSNNIKYYLFDCTEIHDKIILGTTVVCNTNAGLIKGSVVSFPVYIEDSTGDGTFGVNTVLRATGAYLPLKKILRVWGQFELLPDELQEIIRQEELKKAAMETLPY